MFRPALFSVALVLCGCGPSPTAAEDPDAGIGVSQQDEHDHGDPTNAICPGNSTLTWRNFGQPFVTRYCTGCHASYLAGSARHGAPVEHDFDEQWMVREHLAHIDAAAAAGPSGVRTDMPPTRPVPTELERRQLGEWLACGAP